MPRLSTSRTLLLVAIAAALWYFRLHIFVLGEVTATYTTFRLGPEAFYDYNATAGSGLSRGSAKAPAIMHHIFLDEHCTPSIDKPCVIKQKYLDNIQSCRSIHPDWEFRLWTSENATAFVSSRYPDILSAYTRYPQTIQRANILRYLLLDFYGGVYLDLDLSCRANLNPLRSLSWLMPPAHPVGINNAFILSAPVHPFLREALIPRINQHNLRWPLPYVDNMLSTGCMFISAMVMRFRTRDMRVLGGGALHMLRGHVVTPLFEHGGDSTWHRWDAAMFLLIGKYIWQMAWFGVGLALVGLVALALQMLRTRRQQRLVSRYRRRDQESGAEAAKYPQ